MIKTVNRGYIYVQPKQAFCDWAKQHDEDFDFNEETIENQDSSSDFF